MEAQTARMILFPEKAALVRQARADQPRILHFPANVIKERKRWEAKAEIESTPGFYSRFYQAMQPDGSVSFIKLARIVARREGLKLENEA